MVASLPRVLPWAELLDAFGVFVQQEVRDKAPQTFSSICSARARAAIHSGAGFFRACVDGEFSARTH